MLQKKKEIHSKKQKYITKEGIVTTRNKKGFSIIEILAAIMVIGFSSGALVSSVLVALNASQRSESYVLANQVAMSYTQLASKETPGAKVKGLAAPSETGFTYYTISGPGDTNKEACKEFFGEASAIYGALYNSTGTLTLNDRHYDANSVTMTICRITVGSGSLGLYKLTTTVDYRGGEVTYEEQFMYKATN